jgi:hypothetical protein
MLHDQAAGIHERLGLTPSVCARISAYCLNN